MSLNVSSNVDSGYDDVDSLNNAQNELFNKAYGSQKDIINMQTEQRVDEINRNKEKLNEEVLKQNRGLYTDYVKQVNPYGVTAEGLAGSGLGNSGVAESSRTNLYNSYQSNRTNTLNTAKSLLADYDLQINQARQNGDIQLAQSALQIFNKRIDNLYSMYQLKQNEKQFDYQKERDKVSDNRWQTEFDYNKGVDDRNYSYQVDRDRIDDEYRNKVYDRNIYESDRDFEYNKWANDRDFEYNKWANDRSFEYNKWSDDRNYNYQVDRDRVADDRWRQEFNLQKKSISRSSGRMSGNGGGGSDGNNVLKKNYTPKEIIANTTILQGPNIEKNIMDKRTGKTYSSVDELMADYGYAVVE